MATEMISKKEAIGKIKWLRKIINKWGGRFKKEKDYIVVEREEKRRFLKTLRELESYFALGKNIKI
jgi:hypothetical protein